MTTENISVAEAVARAYRDLGGAAQFTAIQAYVRALGVATDTGTLQGEITEFRNVRMLAPAKETIGETANRRIAAIRGVPNVSVPLANLTHPEKTSNKERIIHTSKQAYQLTQWMDNNRDRIRNLKWAIQQVATTASAELKFPITVSHVRRAADLLGISFLYPLDKEQLHDKMAQVRAVKATQWKKMQDACGKVDGLVEQVAALRSELDQIKRDLGVS